MEVTSFPPLFFMQFHFSKINLHKNLPPCQSYLPKKPSLSVKICQKSAKSPLAQIMKIMSMSSD